MVEPTNQGSGNQSQGNQGQGGQNQGKGKPANAGKVAEGSLPLKLTAEVIQKLQETARKGFEFPFYYLELGCPGIKFRDWSQSEDYQRLLADEKSGKLQADNPTVKNAKAYMFMTEDHLKESETIQADENGNLPIPLEFPQLAAYCLHMTRHSAGHPEARLHPNSPRLPEEYNDPKRFIKNLNNNPVWPPQQQLMKAV